MPRSADSRRCSNPLRTALAVAACAAAMLACATSGAAAQYQPYIGPRLLYPQPDYYENYKDIPLVMRDAIQAIAIGTRLIAVKPRIMGGDVAPTGVYPWAASIGLKGVAPRDGHFCGGSFIAPDWVLTAAHCVNANSADKIQVYGGSNDLDAGGRVFTVDRVIVHEKYNEATEDNDVALVHTVERFNNQYLRLVTPAEADRVAVPGEIAVAVGWGLNADGAQIENAQRHVTVEIVSNRSCNGLAAYDGAVTADMLCAGYEQGGHNSCQADSGAPLVVGDRMGSYFQVGVLSWGEGCVRPMKFGVYTRVAAIEAWVADKISMRPVATAPPMSRSPQEFVGPPLPQSALPQVRSVRREPPPRSRAGSQRDAALPQLGPRSRYPQAARETAGLPLPMRDAESFIATGRRLFAVRPRIVGGEPAPPSAYPWTASLELKDARSRNAHFCGAAFIAPDWVLTAAHCVRSASAGSIDVLGGSNDLDRGGKLYPVDRVVVHERYDAGTQDYDVALLHLASRYDGPTIRPITAAEAADFAAPGRSATVAGWGLVAEGTNVSDILRRVNVEIVSPAACNAQAAYGGTVNGELMLCAGFAAGGKDACQGDSGGPLMVMDRAGGFVQAGIVSWGEGCARPNRYGVYTRVSAVEPWIAEHTGERRAPVADAPLPRAAPLATRTRAIAPDVAPPPRSGVRSNSRVELPGSVRAQAKTAKPARKSADKTSRKRHAIKHRAAGSRAEAEAIATETDVRTVSPAAMP